MRLFGWVVLFGATVCFSCMDVRGEESLTSHFEAIEKQAGGRLGVAVLDTSNGRHADYRPDERFPMCSTFKFLAAAAVLERCDKKKENLDRRVVYQASDLLEYAPITKQHLQEGSMTLSALCAAAIEYSDNTAGNLLLQTIGGPEKLTEFVRTLGDSKTRLDRNEPSLNTAIKGDERDTTTPALMVSDMNRLLVENALSKTSREQLERWLVANTTGATRLRASVPSTWIVGDKTGTGENGATNDVAILRPPNRPPLLVAVYFVDSKIPRPERDAVVAKVGKTVVEWAQVQTKE